MLDRDPNNGPLPVIDAVLDPDRRRIPRRLVVPGSVVGLVLLTFVGTLGVVHQIGWITGRHDQNVAEAAFELYVIVGAVLYLTVCFRLAAARVRRERKRKRTDTLAAHPAPKLPASRWITIAAWAVPLCVLPSAIWRLMFVIRAATGPQHACDPRHVGEGLYIASLSVVSLGAAALTIGLVRPWGEVLPAWLPRFGGRPVPARPVSVVAMSGAVLVGLLTAYFLLRLALGIDGNGSSNGCEPPGLEVLGFYAPLVAWSPLLYLVARDYRRRMLG